MSVHLKYGAVHPRTLLADLAGRAGEGADTLRTELAWRDFYADVLWHHPESARENFDRRYDALPWDSGAEADAHFEAWATGRTGFPIVDAGMRQLRETAWMHNRVRMIVASFLVKDLHLHWTRGARHFMRYLADGDLASNQHGWQWAAGTGTDAAPFFRVFNPVSQGERFDPHGDYVRRFVPELRDVRGRGRAPAVGAAGRPARRLPVPDRGPRRGAPGGADPVRARQGPFGLTADGSVGVVPYPFGARGRCCMTEKPTGRRRRILLVPLLGLGVAAWAVRSRLVERRTLQEGWQPLPAAPDPPGAGRGRPSRGRARPRSPRRPSPSRARTRAVPAAAAVASVAAPVTAPAPPVAPFGPGSARAGDDGSSPDAGYAVKGKTATRVFYAPGSPYYSRTRADVWFRTDDDARAAGFTARAPRGSG